MKKVHFLILGAGMMFFAAGCKTEDPLIVQMREASELLEKRALSSEGNCRILAAEADTERNRTEFPLVEKSPSGHVRELRVRIGGAVNEIRRLALDPQSSGHLQALESSARLQLHYSVKDRQILWAIIHAGLHGKNEAIWLLAVNGDTEAEKMIDASLKCGASGELDQLFQAEDMNALAPSITDQISEVVFAARTAGALETLPPDRAENLKKIADVQRGTLCGAAAHWALARHQLTTPSDICHALLDSNRKVTTDAAAYYLLALGEVGGESDLVLLREYLKGEDENLSTAAGQSILKICRRLLPFRERR